MRKITIGTKAINPKIINPKGKVYASADWHGCWAPAEQALKFLNPEDTLIFIGDASDRGQDGLKIIKTLMSDNRVIYMKGNHEAIMASAIREILDGNSFGNTLWALNGGMYTWYDMEMMQDDILIRYANHIDKLPIEVVYKAEDGHKVILEHAGYTPFDMPHRSHDPLWDRDHFYDEWNRGREQEGFDPDNTYLVHGHTPVQYLAFHYGYKNQPEKTKEMMEYARQWNDFDSCDWKPEVIRYCDGHKFDVDMCTIVSDRIALLDLDTFETVYFDAPSQEENE